VPRLGHDRLDDPPVSISRHLQQAADLLRRALVAEELLLALPDGCVLECESTRAVEGGAQGGGKKLDMGKRCVHFKSPDDLPLEAIGKLIAEISSEKWIEMYEQSRLMTKAGQAQKAKQGAPSASKVAAKRVDTKRRR
jgi:hypothetical protein